MTSISLLTLSAFNALEWFLFLKKFRRIVQLLSTFILALRNHLLQHRWVSWRVTSLNSLLELFVDIFPGWIVNLGSCLFFFFFFKVDLFFFLSPYGICYNIASVVLLFGCEAYGILVPWLGIKPSPPVLKVQSLSHWIPREVRCHVHCWTSHGPQHRAWPTVVVQERSRRPLMLRAMTFLLPRRWIVPQLSLNWNIIDVQYCVNFCSTANISQPNFNFFRTEALLKTSETELGWGLFVC